MLKRLFCRQPHKLDYFSACMVVVDVLENRRSGGWRLRGYSSRLGKVVACTEIAEKLHPTISLKDAISSSVSSFYVTKIVLLTDFIHIHTFLR